MEKQAAVEYLDKESGQHDPPAVENPLCVFAYKFCDIILQVNFKFLLQALGYPCCRLLKLGQAATA